MMSSMAPEPVFTKIGLECLLHWLRFQILKEIGVSIDNNWLIFSEYSSFSFPP
eukprot:c9358_g1_i1 orf=1-156(-)